MGARSRRALNFPHAIPSVYLGLLSNKCGLGQGQKTVVSNDTYVHSRKHERELGGGGHVVMPQRRNWLDP